VSGCGSFVFSFLATRIPKEFTQDKSHHRGTLERRLALLTSSQAEGAGERSAAEGRAVSARTGAALFRDVNVRSTASKNPDCPLGWGTSMNGWGSRFLQSAVVQAFLATAVALVLLQKAEGFDSFGAFMAPPGRYTGGGGGETVAIVVFLGVLAYRLGRDYLAQRTQGRGTDGGGQA